MGKELRLLDACLAIYGPYHTTSEGKLALKE